MKDHPAIAIARGDQIPQAGSQKPLEQSVQILRGSSRTGKLSGVWQNVFQLQQNKSIRNGLSVKAQEGECSST